MIPLFSYCCKKPICNVSMIFHIPDIHCLCDGWRRILISKRRILRSEHNLTISFAKINSYISKSFMQHKVIEVDTQDSQTTSSVRDTQDPAPPLSPMGMYLCAVPNKYLPRYYLRTVCPGTSASVPHPYSH